MRYLIVIICLVFFRAEVSSQSYIVDSSIYQDSTSNYLGIQVDNQASLVMYIIQRSTDGHQFEDWRMVRPQATFTVKEVLFEDARPERKTWYRVFEMTPLKTLQYDPVMIENTNILDIGYTLQRI